MSQIMIIRNFIEIYILIVLIFLSLYQTNHLKIYIRSGNKMIELQNRKYKIILSFLFPITIYFLIKTYMKRRKQSNE